MRGLARKLAASILCAALLVPAESLRAFAAAAPGEFSAGTGAKPVLPLAVTPVEGAGIEPVADTQIPPILLPAAGLPEALRVEAAGVLQAREDSARPAPAADERRPVEQELARLEDGLAEASKEESPAAGKARTDHSFDGVAPARPSAIVEGADLPETGLALLEPSVPARASRPKSVPVPRLFAFTGYGLLLSAAGLSALGAGVHPLMTVFGFFSLGAARFFSAPEGPGSPSAPSRPFFWEKLAGRYLPSFAGMAHAARSSLDAQIAFGRGVGAGSAGAFSLWLRAGVRTALYWAPMALLAMLGAAIASLPVRRISLAPRIAGTALGDWLLHAPWLEVLSRQLASAAAQEALLLAGAFGGVRSLLVGLGADPRRASWIAAGAALGLAVPLLLARGAAPALLLQFLAIEAVLIYLYARTGSLLAPVAVRLIFESATLYSARLMGLLQAPAAAGALVGVPGAWAVLAVLGVGGGLYAVLSFMSRSGPELRRLEETGGAWKAPSPDMRPKPFLPLASIAAFWGVASYLVYYLSYWGTYLFFPFHEAVAPGVQKIVMMPLDMLLFIFMLGAALEELVFRKGLFGRLQDRLAKKNFSGRTAFWIAATISAVVFSAAHFIQFDLPGVGEALAATYSFSPAGFVGRAAAGLFFAFLYKESRGVLLIPVLAHFTSNTLEAVGLHWGLAPMLAAVSAVVLLHGWTGARPQRSLSGK